MIIDEILDRRNGMSFDAKMFKDYVLEQARIFQFPLFEEAYKEADGWLREQKVKRAIVLYLASNDYNLTNIPFVLSVSWTGSL